MSISNRIRISTEASSKLKTLKGRTGLTPNLLCRIGLCFSLNGQKITNVAIPNEDGLEFNRFTLTGDYDALIVALIKQRCIQDKLDPEKDFTATFKAHLNNGISCLHSRVRSLSDLRNML